MESKPARDAAAKAKMEAEASAENECPVHVDNEWNIRYIIRHQLKFILLQNTDLLIYFCQKQMCNNVRQRYVSFYLKVLLI
jgi:hypothetical protein